MGVAHRCDISALQAAVMQEDIAGCGIGECFEIPRKTQPINLQESLKGCNTTAVGNAHGDGIVNPSPERAQQIRNGPSQKIR